MTLEEVFQISDFQFSFDEWWLVCIHCKIVIKVKTAGVNM